MAHAFDLCADRSPQGTDAPDRPLAFERSRVTNDFCVPGDVVEARRTSSPARPRVPLRAPFGEIPPGFR
jgi:hypothetical protein